MKRFPSAIIAAATPANQRWPRIRNRIRHDTAFFSDQNSLFIFGSSRGLRSLCKYQCLITNIAEFRLHVVCGVWTGFSNFKKLRSRIRIQKFWNRSRVWKCDSGHLCSKGITSVARWSFDRKHGFGMTRRLRWRLYSPSFFSIPD